MKKLVTIEEDDAEGFMALIGKRITVFCANYIYSGNLVGVNDTCIKLDDACIVYETGPFNTKEWKDSSKFPESLYIQTNAIESFMILK